MAVTVTAVRTGPNQSIANVETDADADVAAVIPHGLGAVPEQVHLEPLLVEYYLNEPIIGVVDDTNVNLTLANAVGSGTAGNQIQVIISRPHSLVE